MRTKSFPEPKNGFLPLICSLKVALELCFRHPRYRFLVAPQKFFKENKITCLSRKDKATEENEKADMLKQKDGEGGKTEKQNKTGNGVQSKENKKEEEMASENPDIKMVHI